MELLGYILIVFSFVSYINLININWLNSLLALIIK